MEKKFDIKEVKVHRTLEGTIFEIATLVIRIVVYAISFVSIMLLLAAYSPKNINLGQELRNIHQVEIAIRTVRIMAVGLAIFCLLMVAVSPDNPIIHTALAVTVVATALISSILIRKAK